MKVAAAGAGTGLSPDGGASWLLPRLIALRQAQELWLRNRRVSAGEAAALGLVACVASGEVLEEVLAVAREQTAGLTGAFGATHSLLLDGVSASLEAHFDPEARSHAPPRGGRGRGR